MNVGFTDWNTMVYESLEACFLHHLHVPEICDLVALSIRNSLIPQSVDP
jgi:hypothetical protein